MQGLEGVPSAAIEPIPDYFSPRRLLPANCVRHGLTDTPFLVRVPQRDPDVFIIAIPMRRLAKPAEIAYAVRGFASDEAGYITGQVLSVGGGLGDGWSMDQTNTRKNNAPV